MIKTEEATEIILGNVRSLSGQRVELLSSLNRVLAEDIYSSLNLPPFDNSAMDGYALIASDTKGSSPASPKILEVVEDLPAGKIATRRVGNGGAVRIMTGAPIPRGADAVIMVENTQSQDSRVLIFQEVRKFENIRKAGEDTRKGALIIGAGTAIKPGKPFLFGLIGDIPVFGLPGNPVSSMVCFEQFVKPALLKMSGRRQLVNEEVNAVSRHDIEKKPGMRHFVRGRVEIVNGRYEVSVTGPQGSGMLSSMTQANAFIVIPEDVRMVRAGQEVKVQLLDR